MIREQARSLCLAQLLFAAIFSFATISTAAQTIEPDANAANLSSSYIPVDSWIYPAFELLISRGLARSAFLNRLPWTRETGARLIEEADDLAPGSNSDENTAETLIALEREFAFELRGRKTKEVVLESLTER